MMTPMRFEVMMALWKMKAVTKRVTGPRPQAAKAWPAILVDVGATEDRQSLRRLFVCDLHENATCA